MVPHDCWPICQALSRRSLRIAAEIGDPESIRLLGYVETIPQQSVQRSEKERKCASERERERGRDVRLKPYEYAVCMYNVCLPGSSVSSYFSGCMYVYMYTCIHVCIYACMYVCMYVCIYLCIYVCMYVCVCMYVRTYVRTNVCVHVCM